MRAAIWSSTQCLSLSKLTASMELRKMPQDILDDLREVSGVYTIIHTASGRAYVGEALDISVRWNTHMVTLRRGTHKNLFLQRSWKKYGDSEFEFKVFLILSRNPGETNRQLKRRLRIEEARVWLLFDKTFNSQDISINQNLGPGPKTRRKMKKSAKLSWQEPEAKEKRVAAFNTEEGQENRAKGASSGWKLRKKKIATDPEFAQKHKITREKANVTLKKLCDTPEKRKQLSEQAYKSWEDPERHVKVSNSLLSHYAIPENQEKHKANMQTLWANPEWKAKTLESRRKKKAERKNLDN